MTKRAKVAVGAVLAVALVAGLYLVNRYWIAPVATRPAKSAGERPPAPDFTITDLAGQKLSLYDYKGKVVLLDFWATWCGPCRIEIPGFVELQRRYRDQGLQVIGIAVDDDPESVREFYREYKMNYPVAIGDEKLGELFGGILGLPTSFLIGRDGRIHAKHVGLTNLSTFEEEIKELLEAKGAGESAPVKTTDSGRQVERAELAGRR